MTSIYDHPDYPLIQAFFNEPDFYEGCAFGLPIHMRRNAMKAWCGYAGVPKTHPLYGKDHSERVPADRNSVLVKAQSPISLLVEALRDDDGAVSLDVLIDCPGGITWARPKVPWGGLPGYWYFGFDCSHYNDLSPKDVIEQMITRDYWRSGVYRTFDFVLLATRQLAEQLAHFGDPE